MSFVIKDRHGNARIHRDQEVLGSDSSEAVVRDISAQTRSFTICASSDRKDRMGDIVVQSGLDMTNFDKNPVILWAHQHSEIPIGRCVQHFQDKKGTVTRTMMRVQLSAAEDAQKVFDAVRDGFLKSASIGFIPLKTEKIEQDKDEDKPPFYNPTRFLKSELLECSICSVGANPDATMALKDMAAKGRLPATYCKGCGNCARCDQKEGSIAGFRFDKSLLLFSLTNR